ncbi:hypothetical protein VTO42DRAFT_1474 [Malbranchea cinnamomea]
MFLNAVPQSFIVAHKVPTSAWLRVSHLVAKMAFWVFGIKQDFHHAIGKSSVLEILTAFDDPSGTRVKQGYRSGVFTTTACLDADSKSLIEHAHSLLCLLKVNKSFHGGGVLVMPDSGKDIGPDLVGDYRGINEALNIAIIVITALSLYNAVELVVLIFLRFRRHSGLYFWSLLLSTVPGVVLHTLGYLFAFFNIGPIGLAITLSVVGWYFLVPGQSAVLYSRLHLVLRHTKILRYIRWFIIIASLTVVIPTTVLSYGSRFTQLESFRRGYSIMERVQLTWFSVQESVLGVLYIVETIKLFRLSPEKAPWHRKVMWELFAINIVMIGMDITLMLLEYLGLFIWQVLLKSVIYSIKLKLELAVLSQLISLIHPRSHPMAFEERRLSFVSSDQPTTREAPAPSPTRRWTSPGTFRPFKETPSSSPRLPQSTAHDPESSRVAQNGIL